MSYSAIVVAWNAAATLESCLESIVGQELDTPLETIVVDNASSDGTAQLLGRYQDWVRVIRNAENLGFSAANNRAAEVASGEILFLLNADTRLVGPRLLHDLADALRPPDVGLVGPRLLNPDGSLQPSAHHHPSPLRAILVAGGVHRLLPSWESADEGDVGWLMGAALAIDRRLFLRVGGFWAQPYGQDEDLALKVQRLGLGVRYVPGAEVVHVGNVSGHQRWAGTERAAEVARAELAILAGHYGRFRGALIRWITYLAYGGRAVVLRALRRKDRAAIYAVMAHEYLRSESPAAARDG